MRIETFYLYVPGGYITITRNEALRAMIAAVYETAKALPAFTTDDVFARVNSVYASADHIRKATANSKLIAVALKKAAALGYCTKTAGLKKGADATSNFRPKRIWASTLPVQADLTVTS